jgi:hypothetical protein
MTKQDQAAGALTVKCPACKANPGEPCTQATNTGRRNVQWVHNARRDLAEGWT